MNDRQAVISVVGCNKSPLPLRGKKKGLGGYPGDLFFARRFREEVEKGQVGE